jgi:alkylation response protein AidB-like acyl-CoA dehydrogenase
MTGPLSFSISAEQEALVDVARSFGERQLAPYYKQREREGAFDRTTLRAMGRLGHGAYTEEMPYAQRLRDVLGLQIGDGTAQIMKLIIARHKAGRCAVSA